MKIILIRNYRPDNQESMRRFADMLETGFRQVGIQVINWAPKAIFGKSAASTIQGAGKWLGYIDKWILFPVFLIYKALFSHSAKRDYYFHICDHSNSLYLNYLPKNKTRITCHDVLAIRGALGFADAHCTASGFGKILQKRILKSLSHANNIACVSHLTFRQLSELLPYTDIKSKNWIVIHNALNADFAPMPTDLGKSLLRTVNMDTNVPFILHVGSSLPRKNRKLLVEMLFKLGSRWKGNICFAGHAIDDKLKQYIEEKKLTHRVISIVKPNHGTLTALYSLCEAFVFPSFSEGFGWPVIEAQICGAPVIASSIEPMPEVSGGAAIHADPNDAEAFADALLELQKSELKDKMIIKGFENVRKFSLPVITRQYLRWYGLKPMMDNVS